MRLRLSLCGLLLASVASCAPDPDDLPTPVPPVAAETPTTVNLPPEPPGATDIANQRFSLPLSIRDAEAILTKTEMFVWNHLPATQVYAYTVFLREPDAHARILAVARDGRWAGQLYALCGLRHLRAQEADGLARRLSEVDEPIHYYDGRSRDVSVRDLVEMIELEKVWVALEHAGKSYR
jgi:hypothetical protein